MSAITPNTPASAARYEPRDEILTKKELAAKLKVGVRSVESWQADELIPSFKVRGVVRFYWPDVLEKLNTTFRFCRRGVTAPLTKGGNQ